MECRNCLRYNGKACELGLSLPCGEYVPHIINPSDKQGDLISRSALLENRFRMHSEFLGTVSVVSVKDIETAPAVDAVPVVRCEDCKNTMLLNLFSISDNRVEEKVLHCGILFGRVQPDDFCSWGERRADGNNE